MPEFAIHTEEYWLHRVDYALEAPSLDDDMQRILRGEESYASAEVIEGADAVMTICTVNDPKLSDADNERLLREHKARRH